MDELLKAYAKSGTYPFHMPGHKRQTITSINPYEIDITEIDGFDNLHHPTGVIARLEQQLAELYGAKAAFLLVNGTTCGNEASIFAATHEGDTVIVARGCHKSVYHAMILRHLRPVYLQSTIRDDGIAEPVTLQQVQQAMKEHPEASAVILTSPTYEGLCANIPEIAKAVHENDMILLVDAAHGAHFGLHPKYPKNPITQGADVATVSLHKTLPTFTQTACLLMSKNSRVKPQQIRKYLGYFESSSPSYILMASVAGALRYIEDEGKSAMEAHLAALHTLREHTKEYRNITIAIPTPWQEGLTADPSKIIIRGKDRILSGEAISSYLRRESKLELEMATPTYALAMTSFMDTKEGYERLKQALQELDTKAEKMQLMLSVGEVRELYQSKRKAGMPLAKAAEATTVNCPMEEAAGHLAGSFISLYPPGIPVYAPGECVSEEGIRAIKEAVAAGFAVDGVDEGENIKIIRES